MELRLPKALLFSTCGFWRSQAFSIQMYKGEEDRAVLVEVCDGEAGMLWAVLAYIPLARLSPVTTCNCKGDWEMKSSRVLCVKAPGKLLLHSIFTYTQLKSEYDCLLAPVARPSTVAAFSLCLPLLNPDICSCPSR